MGEEEVKKVEAEAASEPAPPPPPPETVVAPKDVAEEKAVIPPPPEGKVDEPKEAPEPTEEKSDNRDAVLARVETEKRLSLIRAWEDSEKTKAENK
nr:TPA_asm: hypothetical protein HUJ06_020328 [Nelumbo nucifera]